MKPWRAYLLNEVVAISDEAQAHPQRQEMHTI